MSLLLALRVSLVILFAALAVVVFWIVWDMAGDLREAARGLLHPHVGEHARIPGADVPPPPVSEVGSMILAEEVARQWMPPPGPWVDLLIVDVFDPPAGLLEQPDVETSPPLGLRCPEGDPGSASRAGEVVTTPGPGWPPVASPATGTNLVDVPALLRAQDTDTALYLLELADECAQIRHDLAAELV